MSEWFSQRSLCVWQRFPVFILKHISEERGKCCCSSRLLNVASYLSQDQSRPRTECIETKTRRRAKQSETELGEHANQRQSLDWSKIPTVPQKALREHKWRFLFIPLFYYHLYIQCACISVPRKVKRHQQLMFCLRILMTEARTQSVSDLQRY